MKFTGILAAVASATDTSDAVAVLAAYDTNNDGYINGNSEIWEFFTDMMEECGSACPTGFDHAKLD